MIVLFDVRIRGKVMFGLYGDKFMGKAWGGGAIAFEKRYLNHRLNTFKIRMSKVSATESVS